jgi:hypothetical protein
MDLLHRRALRALVLADDSVHEGSIADIERTRWSDEQVITSLELAVGLEQDYETILDYGPFRILQCRHVYYVQQIVARKWQPIAHGFHILDCLEHVDSKIRQQVLRDLNIR